MIRFFLLQNKQGQRRLSKWYSGTLPDDQERLKIEADIHRIIILRDKKYTNFVEYRNIKIVYRKYAGLYFIFGMDVSDNELLAMETIHLFVELMDQYFSNVCELDIVFHFNKVYNILDELILAGEVQDSSKHSILDRMTFIEALE
jgi:AP-2 complex subunit sigma-1